MMRRIFSLLAAAVVGFGSAMAVTPDEMEQARTIAAQQYLRWANDGSGYLDEMSPKTMTQLEKGLKAKEKENIASFKAVKIPSASEYAAWDKEKLVVYWSETFFKSPGLIEKGKSARNRVKSKIQKMTVSAPAPAKKEEAKSDAPADAAAKPSDQPADKVAKAQAQSAMKADSMAMAAEAASVVEEALAVDSAEEIAAEASHERNAGSSVWIYIIALCVLVGVVVWLVIFASKTMKNTEDYPEVEEQSRRLSRRSSRKDDEEESASGAVVIDGQRQAEPVAAEPEGVDMLLPDSTASDSKLREKYAESLARKNEEIRALNRQLLDLREECFRLGEENGRLTSELALARKSMEVREPVEVVTPSVPKSEEEKGEAPTRRRRSAASREIYLGRVNSKGLFVRADRELTPGKSVYRLTTSDGFTGTYRVVTDEDMMDTMLDSPVEFLGGGCVAKDLEDTDGMMEIVTESAGTAIFEDGCWRVLRKAKISYK